MPTINRIRVNNVKYNFGTQCYDDFVMRMYGRNTLYDLANGGGKSVLMLLLLQNLIPNCTLDDKQPIEKLFRSGGGNTVIHSLIEWKLDESKMKDGFRYMTTGFCARKAKEEDDGLAIDAVQSKKDTASIEYFNYCIFYRDYNKNDIVNLPLTSDGERITFSGLKNYIRDLSKKDFNLEVHLFERKGEYQRFISHYGLYESHWEIIRGINKTEGHVRTYFESNYKTTRKVVEDLLIEEIIEKAYLNKTEQSDEAESMAKNLLDIKDKLLELSKKKRDIDNFDREIELVNVLSGRVTSFLTLFNEREKMRKTIANVYATGKSILAEDEQRIEKLSGLKEDKLKEKDEKKCDIESLKVKELDFSKKQVEDELKKIAADIEELKAELEKTDNELKLKESMNDYMELKRDTELKLENETMLRAAGSGKQADIKRLNELAYTKAKRNERKLAELTAEQKREAAGVLELQKINAEKSSLLGEALIALEVAKNNVNRAQTEAENYLSSMSRLKGEANVLILKDSKELLKQNEDDISTCDMLIHSLEEELSCHEKEYQSHLHEQDKTLIELERAEAEQKVLEEKLSIYLENSDRINNMMRIYEVGKQEELLSAINERLMKCIVDATNKKEELKRLAKKRAELTEERIIGESEAIEKVKNYIETRHGESAVFGMDYVAARKPAERAQLLSEFKLLPYGVVVKSFDFLKDDEALRELKLGDSFVPIFSEELIFNPMGRETDNSVIYISKEAKHFTDEELLKKALSDCDDEIKELEERVKHLSELGITYEDDIEYISGLGSDISMAVMDSLSKKKAEVLNLDAKAENEKAICHDLTLAMTQDKEAIELEKEKLKNLTEDSKRLIEVRLLSEQMDKLESDKADFEKEVSRLSEKEKELRRESEAAANALYESGKKLKSVEKAIETISKEWEELYKSYYVENGDYSEADLSDEELDAEFKAGKALYEQENVALDDKKKLIETLDKSIDRLTKSIKKRGVSLEVLSEMDRAHEMYRVKDEILGNLMQNAAAIESDISVATKKLTERQGEISRLSGVISQSIKQIEERFGAYKDIEISETEVKNAIEAGDKVLATCEAEYKELSDTYDKAVKQAARMRDLYKDVERIMISNEINPKDATIIHESEANMRRLFEDSLLRYDKTEKSLDKARAELLKYKSHTAETLFSMGAFELSETIGRDIEVPEDLTSANQLLESLAEIISFIELEKDRVEKGIADMEFVKTSFEAQCIERCKDVKTELDKLPKLSKISVDGEMIQMVGLSIPYVKDEFIKQRMSDYIDDVVSGADTYDDPKDRMKYIRGRLVLKKLFSVIVTDMNAIKLTLYKRERIKEQSRYLKYEEAVGSTGQSQGIYIQFLISVINYISGMYSAGTENETLKKTIFIDNPFGAAKDIYIWEPIFALLKANAVQLIVPARGATPAITARFDVNYILGQQMIGKKQQTVVVDYRSQVEQEEMEYKELDYEQATFDFV